VRRNLSLPTLAFPPDPLVHLLPCQRA